MNQEDIKSQELLTLNGIRNISSMKGSVNDILTELRAILIRLEVNQTEDVIYYVKERILSFEEELETLDKSESIFIKKLNKIYKVKGI